MEEKKQPSLIELRKKANSLGIQNYAKYSKEELVKLIEQAEAGIKTYIDPDYIEGEEDTASETPEIDEDGEVDVTETEKEKTSEAEEKPKKEKKVKKEPKEKKVKDPKEKKERKPKSPRKKATFNPKRQKPEGLSETSSKIYDELLNSNGRSVYQISKDLNTYYSVVSHIAEKYFDVVEQPVEKAE